MFTYYSAFYIVLFLISICSHNLSIYISTLEWSKCKKKKKNEQNPISPWPRGSISVSEILIFTKHLMFYLIKVKVMRNICFYPFSVC